MTMLKFWVAMTLALPLAAFAAANTDSDFRAISPAIDSWAVGTVTAVDCVNGNITIRGRNLSYATVHAQMRQDLGSKLIGVDDKAQRRQIAAQVHRDWSGRLQAAMKQQAGEPTDLTFKPADEKNVAILEGRDIRELAFFQKLAAERKERVAQAGEVVALETALNNALVAGTEDAAQPTSYNPEAIREKAAERRENIGENAAARAEAAKQNAAAMTAEEQARAAEKRENIQERIAAGRAKLAAERLSLDDLNPGDKVLVGYDMDSGSYYTIVRGSPVAPKCP